MSSNNNSNEVTFKSFINKSPSVNLDKKDEIVSAGKTPRGRKRRKFMTTL